jgi:phospholipid-translocating ATPase
VVFIANLQLAVIIQYWTWIHHFTIWGSIIVYICFLLVLSAFPVEWSGEGAGIFQGIVAKAPSFYILVLLLIVAALLPDFVMRSYLW